MVLLLKETVRTCVRSEAQTAQAHTIRHFFTRMQTLPDHLVIQLLLLVVFAAAVAAAAATRLVGAAPAGAPPPQAGTSRALERTCVFIPSTSHAAASESASQNCTQAVPHPCQGGGWRAYRWRHVLRSMHAMPAACSSTLDEEQSGGSWGAAHCEFAGLQRLGARLMLSL